MTSAMLDRRTTELTNHIDLTFNLRQHYINPRTRSGIVATPCTKVRLKVLSQYKVFWRNFIGILIRFGFRPFYNKIFRLTAYSIVFINRRFMWICYRHETTCAPFANSIIFSSCHAFSWNFATRDTVSLHGFAFLTPWSIRCFTLANTVSCSTDPKKILFQNRRI